MSKLSQISFLTNSGGTESLTVQHYDDLTDMEYWEDSFDEAIDGSLRQNVRGLRKKFKVTYDASKDASTFRSIINNIVTDLLNGAEFFYVGVSGSSYYRVTLDQDVLYKAQYMNQRGLFIPQISMIGYELGIEVLEVVTDYRYITEAVTENYDWGYITVSATTFEDYGSI